MAPLNAEEAYVFRHALLRDAAYQLHLPRERARRHALALEAIEEFCGVPPAPPPLAVHLGQSPPHPADPFAVDLAHHARLAQPEGHHDSALQSRERLYVRRAAEEAERRYLQQDARILWEWLARLTDGDQKGLSLVKAATAAAMSGNIQPAERLFSEAATLHARTGNLKLEASARNALGVLLNDSGRLDHAERSYRRALELARAAADPGTEGIALANMAGLFHATSRKKESLELLQQALAIHRQAGNRRSEGVALQNLGGIYRSLGQDQAAENYYLAALAVSRETGYTRSEGFTLGNLASLYADLGRMDEAEQCYARAIEIDRETGSARAEAIHQCDFATFLVRAGRHDEAKAAWRRGAPFLRALNDVISLEHKTSQLRRVCRAAGVPDLPADFE